MDQTQQQSYDPNELVTLTNDKTGAVKQVKRSDLPQFGLDPTYQSQADIAAKNIMNGGADISSVPDKYKVGAMSVLNANNYFQNKKQKEADAQKEQAYGITKGTIQNLLDTYGNLPGYDKGGIFRGATSILPFTQSHEYEAQRKGLGAALKDVAGAGQGSGVRVTQSELNAWGNLLPSPSKTDAQNKIDIISLQKQLVGKFGKGLDDNYLKQFGVTSADLSKNKSQLQSSNSLPEIIGRAGKGAVGDIKDLGQGIIDEGGRIYQRAKQGETPSENIANTAIEMGKGLVNEYGKLVGVTAKNGQPILDPNKSVFNGGVNTSGIQFDPGEAINHAIDHPVDTLLDLSPFLPKIKGAVAGKTEDLVNTTKGNLPPITSTAGKILTKAGTAAKQGNVPIDLPASVYGAGQEAAVRGTLDKLGISKGNPIQQYSALQPAMDQLGSFIEDTMAKNPKSFKIDDIVKDFDTNLNQNGIYRRGELTKDAAQNAARGYIEDLYKSNKGTNVVPDEISDSDLFQLKKDINNDYKAVAKKKLSNSTLTDKEKVIEVARQTIDDIISNAHPQVKQATTMQSHLYDAADSLKKAAVEYRDQAGPGVNVFGIKAGIPAGFAKGVGNVTGNILQGMGDKINPPLPPIESQAPASATLKTPTSTVQGSGFSAPSLTPQQEAALVDEIINPEQGTKYVRMGGVKPGVKGPKGYLKEVKKK